MAGWFDGDPEISQTPVKTVREQWICPKKGCGGEMIFNGMSWPTSTPGYHHTCNTCEYTTAVRGVRYPRITHVTISET